MFSLPDAREAQVQTMEKHSDPVLFSGLRPYEVLSGASAVKCCPMLSNVIKCCQSTTKCCQVLTSQSQPAKNDGSQEPHADHYDIRAK